AIRYIRANAHEWKINPDRIGVLGFSSGGHVAASLGTRFAETVYTPIDNVDEQPARPAFMALVYPVVTLREDIGHPGSRL
ncbi:alpha/beta hydrolase, partial [Pseudomonas aeruginosa]